MPIVPAYTLCARAGWVWCDMGLLRLLLKLFAPKRPRYRYRQSSNSYRPVSAPEQPVQESLWEPLRQVEHQTGQQIIRGHCWVIDGDTIVINKVHIRLAGIDAPELDQPFGQIAKRSLMNLCRGQVVTAMTDGSTTYERAVATCTLDDGRDLAAEMVRAGHALDWGKHSGGRYRHLEVDGIRKKLWRVEARHRGRMPPKERAG
jgi:micrococcal nuclease